MNNKSDYKVGIYIRLSREDGDDLESESIGNQRSMITGYLFANGIIPIDEYVDDGYSGGNFNRPGFKRLLIDIEKKKINMIITKDLSRLGRDYIETGMYIEKYFPENNIRYIAINDGLDTFKDTTDDLLPFRLGMNDMYAKDISKKVRSSLLTMKKNGKYCGSTPPYGYVRDPNNKYKLKIDEETAEVVRKIFDLYINGYSSSKIAYILTCEEIKTPILRDNMIGRSYKFSHPEIWKHSSVSNIIKNKTYTGCLIQHTTFNVNYKSKKRKSVPKKEWIVIENSHESIIDEKTFELAQKIKNKHNTYSNDRRNVDYLLSNLVYCKDCNKKMSISYDKKRDRVTMNCSTYRKLSKYNICFSHYINYEKLEKLLLFNIRDKCLFHINPKDFEELFSKKVINPTKEIDDKINQCINKINRLELKIDNLYDDKFNKIIDNDMYKRLLNNTKIEITSVNNKIGNLKEEKLKIINIDTKNTNYKKIVNDFFDLKYPTKEMINKIVKKIYITKDKKIEIYYNIKNPKKILV